MTEVLEYPVYDEAAELFGAPPVIEADNRIGTILHMVLDQEDRRPPLEILFQAGGCAVAMQGEAYTDVLGATMETCLDLRATDPDQLRDFFHKAARYGETRMLAMVIANLFTMFAPYGAAPAGTRN